MYKTILINKNHPFQESFLKKITLKTIKDIFNNDIQIEEETLNAYLELQAFLETKNIIIGLSSAYRTLNQQQDIYDAYLDKYGLSYTKKTVADAGYSEHHTGLALDLSLFLDGKFLSDNTALIENVSLFEEIHKYLAKFGFILRYPKNKEAITGYSYEPWHIRYVGKFIAEIISQNNYTLEEYLTNYSGLLIINKEKNMTSFDVVHKISNLFGIKKVGHTGTLDPLAEGVLIVALNKATKIVELITAKDKEYVATVKLGYKTDTLDSTGSVLETKEIPSNLHLKETLASFQKTYLQEVPLYSAVKVKGKKLYEYARNKQKVTLPKKEVTIKNIELLSETTDTFTFKATVSKGTYIRSLINDIAAQLNTYGTMTSLTRTKQGQISIVEAKTLKEIENNDYTLLPIEKFLSFPSINVDNQTKKKIITGQKIPNTYNISDKVIFKDQENNLLGIYEVENNYLKVWKNFI